ncbi:hypothetical protein BdWA1_003071 [Babesia duncani]|uniref:Uncharacterized protein n=1 Tax=Babesia duncani TaxID=323732 RepID=A0AAD9PIC6_9APIC|nr:hypothetical protein BdWA1_003071 [Babesia duncani]
MELNSTQSVLKCEYLKKFMNHFIDEFCTIIEMISQTKLRYLIEYSTAYFIFSNTEDLRKELAKFLSAVVWMKNTYAVFICCKVITLLKKVAYLVPDEIMYESFTIPSYQDMMDTMSQWQNLKKISEEKIWENKTTSNQLSCATADAACGGSDDIEVARETWGNLSANHNPAAYNSLHFGDTPNSENEYFTVEEFNEAKKHFVVPNPFYYNRLDVKFKDIIMNGRMPKINNDDSYLEIAVRAALIIIQESGLLDQICHAYGIVGVKTRILGETPFRMDEKFTVPLNVKNEFFFDNNNFGSILNPSGVEYKLQIKRPSENDDGGSDAKLLYLAYMTFADSLFPEIDYNTNSRPYDSYTLEHVLETKRIQMCRYTRGFGYNLEDEPFIKLWTTVASLITNIISLRYLRGLGKIEVKWNFSRKSKIITELGYVDMAIMHFVPENLIRETNWHKRLKKSSNNIFSNYAYIIVHRKFRINSLMAWIHFVEDHKNSHFLVYTNFKTRSNILKYILPSQLDFFLISPLTIDDKKLMDRLKTDKCLGAVVWGLNSEKVDKDYNIIQLPFFMNHTIFFPETIVRNTVIAKYYKTL